MGLQVDEVFVVEGVCLGDHCFVEALVFSGLVTADQ
jgi:hypothetical protein